jgi:hypothetical protein
VGHLACLWLESLAACSLSQHMLHPPVTSLRVFWLQDPALASAGGKETLGSLLHRMLGLLSHPDPMLPVFEAAAAQQRELQRMVAEQRFLMQTYLEQQKLLAAQHALRPLVLSAGPVAAYFDASAQQQEAQRQQQELFALASQPTPQQLQQQQEQQEGRGAEAAEPEPAAAAQLLLHEQPAGEAGAGTDSSPQNPVPMAVSTELVATEAEIAAALDPEGEAAAPSGEPELAAASLAEAAAAEAADAAAAAAHATAQAAVALAAKAAAEAGVAAAGAAAIAAAQTPAVASVDEAMAEAAEGALQPPEAEAAAEAVAMDAEDSPGGQLSDRVDLPPSPPLSLPAAAAPVTSQQPEASAEVVAGAEGDWLAAYLSEPGGSGSDAEGAAVQGTLRCAQTANAVQPMLADAGADVAAAPARTPPPQQQQQHQQGQPAAEASCGDGGVLRLRGGGGARKRPRGDDSGGGGGSSAAGAAAAPGCYGEEVVGRPIMVYWKEEKTYYTGSITKYNQQTG